MRIGTLDHSIVIQSATTTQDASGQPIQSWLTFASVLAARRDVRGSERFTSEQTLATRTAVYRMRWLSGINEKMRVVDDGVTYGVMGIADNYRQGWLELSVEALNPADIT